MNIIDESMRSTDKDMVPNTTLKNDGGGGGLLSVAAFALIVEIGGCGVPGAGVLCAGAEADIVTAEEVGADAGS